MIAHLDLARSKILKQTLRFSVLTHLFHSRSSRILTLALVALSFYFAVSLYFPLWVLLIGPILWGVPHLISSLRYNTLLGLKFAPGKKLFYLQGSLWFSVFLYRLGVDYFQLSLFLADDAFLFESLALLLSFSAQIYFSKHFTWVQFISFLFFSALIAVTHFFPMETGLILLIGHNYIPLWTWHQSCQNQKDRRVFFIVSFFYILFSLLTLSGWAQHLYSWVAPQLNLPFLNWYFLDVVEPFGARAEDANFWFRFVSLYAFSQSIHYFLWIKAIPENYQNQSFPPSFRWSFQKLRTDFGSVSFWILLILVGFGAGYWLFFEYQSARVIYFAISSYHGFMEISCLPFLKSNRSSAWMS